MSFASVFSRLRPALMLGAAALLPATLSAQSPGSLDTSFLSPLIGSTVYAVATDYTVVKKEPFQYIAMGGDQDGLFVTYNSGLIVNSFAYPPFGTFDRIVYTIVPETYLDPKTGISSQKLLLGGAFGKAKINNIQVPSRNVERLDLETGALDATFDGVSEGANDFVTSILPLDDGRILVGGLFTKFNKLDYPRLVLLGSTGYVDTNFQPVPVQDGVLALALEADPATGAFDGKIIVGGTFSAIGSGNYTKLARIDLAGNVDPTFKPVIDSRVLAIATQPDGKIVIGGEFSIINGQAVGHLARLNQDGSLDPTFNASVSVVPEGTTAPVAVYVLKLLADGRLYVGGQFSAVDGVTRHYLGVISSDGSLDANFDPGKLITNSVQSLAIQTDGRVLVGETLSKKPVDSNTFPPSLIRLYGASPIINLTASKPNAREGNSAKGVFVFKRAAADSSAPLTVYFQLSGTAIQDVDYLLKKAAHVGGDIYSVTFAAGLTKTKVKIKTLDSVVANAPATVTLKLLPSVVSSTAYESGTAVATVYINNAL